jgi:hypothetical protein
MATKKSRRITDEASEPRASITVKNAVLLSGFFVLLVLSIVTVMIPELSDDGAEDEADAQGQADESDDPPPDDGASAAPTAPAATP